MPVTSCFFWPIMSQFKLIKIGQILALAAVQDSSFSDLVTDSASESDIFLFQRLQSTAELSQTRVTLLTINQKDKETWYDQQEDKDKLNDRHGGIRDRDKDKDIGGDLVIQ